MAAALMAVLTMLMLMLLLVVVMGSCSLSHYRRRWATAYRFAAPAAFEPRGCERLSLRRRPSAAPR